MVETGLDLTGRVPGRLHGRFRGLHGTWLGVVNYEIRYADNRSDVVRLIDQVVPFSALRRFSR
ncbi:hypothetical protein GCM10010483_19690 [Actinokineospora diospyrosa]